MGSTGGSAPLDELIRRLSWIQPAAPRSLVGLFIVDHCFNQRLCALRRAYPSQAMVSMGGSAPAVAAWVECLDPGRPGGLPLLSSSAVHSVGQEDPPPAKKPPLVICRFVS